MKFRRKKEDDYGFSSDTERVTSRGSAGYFFIGLIVFGIGAYIIMQNTTLSSSFGLSRLLGGYEPPFGLVLMPLLIGLVMLFFNDRSILGWILFVGGILFILVGILMGLKIYFRPVSLFTGIIMYGMAAAGMGLILKGLFGRN